MSERKKCFVVSPIGHEGSDERKHADLVLNYIIKPIVQKEGYDVVRGDHIAQSGMITVGIINALLDSDLVIADLSFLNPNVFYELGLRHSTKKATIHIASHDTDIPFDTADHRAIRYDLSDWESHERARARLLATIQNLSSFDSVTNPVTLAKTHAQAQEFSSLVNALNAFLKQLEDRITQAAEKIAEPPGPGHITREYYKNITEQHKSEIMELVHSIRQRIDAGDKLRTEAPPSQVSEMLNRLGHIEQIVKTLRPENYIPESTTRQ